MLNFGIDGPPACAYGQQDARTSAFCHSLLFADSDSSTKRVVLLSPGAQCTRAHTHREKRKREKEKERERERERESHHVHTCADSAHETLVVRRFLTVRRLTSKNMALPVLKLSSSVVGILNQDVDVSVTDMHKTHTPYRMPDTVDGVGVHAAQRSRDAFKKRHAMGDE